MVVKFFTPPLSCLFFLSRLCVKLHKNICYTDDDEDKENSQPNSQQMNHQVDVNLNMVKYLPVKAKIQDQFKMIVAGKSS